MSTLTINFTASVIPPSFGYKINYWDVTTPGTVLTTTVTTSPATITGLTGTSYSGTVQAMCTSGGSTPQSFTATVSGPVSANLTLTSYSCNSVLFIVDQALTSSFTIDALSINGFRNTTCSIATEPALVDILQSPIICDPSFIGFYVGTTIGFGCDVLTYNVIPSITINGVVIPNNGTFTVGGTIVTVNLPVVCTNYSCTCQ